MHIKGIREDYKEMTEPAPRDIQVQGEPETMARLYDEFSD